MQVLVLWLVLLDASNPDKMKICIPVEWRRTPLCKNTPKREKKQGDGKMMKNMQKVHTSINRQ